MCGKATVTNVKLGEALGTLFAGYISFSLAGVVRSAATPPPARPVTETDGTRTQSELAVAEVVTSMYSGGGVDASACTHDVTFTDPAANCCGKPEVVEAFRALAASCRPEAVEDKARQGSASAAQWAACPKLSDAWSSLGHRLPLREASKPVSLRATPCVRAQACSVGCRCCRAHLGFRSRHRPEHVEPPLAIREQPRGSGFEHEYFLHQRYFRSPWWRGLEVRSSLLVQTGADGRTRPGRQGGTGFG